MVPLNPMICLGKNLVDFLLSAKQRKEVRALLFGCAIVIVAK